MNHLFYNKIQDKYDKMKIFSEVTLYEIKKA